MNQWHLGKSEQIKAQPRKEATLAMIALAMLALIPFGLIISRPAAEFLGGGIAILFVYRSITYNNWGWFREPITWVLFFLWFYLMFMVSPFALEPLISLYRSFMWLRHPLFFLAIIYWLSDYGDELKIVLKYNILIISFVIVDTIFQYITGTSITGHVKEGNRLRGPFTKLVVGIFLAKMTLPILGMWLYRSVKAKNRNQIILALLFVIASFATVMLSNERTALMTFTLGLGVIGLVMLTNKRTRWPAIFTGIGIAITAATIFLTQPAVNARAQESHKVISNFTESPYGQLWLASIKVWQKYPILGSGMYGFREACPELLDTREIKICDMHSHNTYLEFLSETGIIGFAAYLTFIFLLLRLMITTPLPGEEESLILRTFAIATFVPTFFPLAATQSFFSNWPAWLAWFSFGVSVMMIKCISKKA